MCFEVLIIQQQFVTLLLRSFTLVDNSIYVISLCLGLTVDMAGDSKAVAFYVTGGFMTAAASAYAVAIAIGKYKNR